MESLPENQTAPIRVLRYYTWTRRCLWFLVVLLFLLSGLLYAWRWYGAIEQAEVIRLMRAILAATIPWSLLARLLFVVRPKLYSQYELYSDRLVENRGRTKKVFYFSAIKNISLSWLPPRFGGGFTVRLDPSQKLHFYSILEGSHEILVQMLSHQNEEEANHPRIKSYLYKIRNLHISMKRLRMKWARPLVILLIYMIIPLALAQIVVQYFDLWQYQPILIFLGIIKINALIALFLSELEESWVLSRTDFSEGSLKTPSLVVSVRWILHYLILFLGFFTIYYFLKS